MQCALTNDGKWSKKAAFFFLLAIVRARADFDGVPHTISFFITGPVTIRKSFTDFTDKDTPQKLIAC